MRMCPEHTCPECGHTEGNKNWTAQVLTRQASVISSMLSTTARIDEARLRGRGKNKIGEILAAIQAERTGKAN